MRDALAMAAASFQDEALREARGLAMTLKAEGKDIPGGAIMVVDPREGMGFEIAVGEFMRKKVPEDAARRLVAEVCKKAASVGDVPVFCCWNRAEIIRDMLIDDCEDKDKRQLTEWFEPRIKTGFVRVVIIDSDGAVDFAIVPYEDLGDA